MKQQNDSIIAALNSKAIKTGMAPAALFQHYAMECFLKKLAASPYASRFFLKGGMLIMALTSVPARTTMDIDLLGRVSNEPQKLQSIFRTIIHSKGANIHGIEFSDNFIISEISKDAMYVGQRVEFSARLGKLKIPMKIDIGFSDEIYPAPLHLAYPTLLSEEPTLNLWSYTPESLVAEKWHAMVKLNRINSRMKDVYDLWLLSHNLTFEYKTLQQAILQAFEKRHTSIEDYHEICSEDYLRHMEEKWYTYISKLKANVYRWKPPVVLPPKDFALVFNEIIEWLGPAMQDKPLKRWKPGQGWQ